MGKPAVVEKKEGAKGKEVATGGGMCTAKACKSSDARFGFCAEHYEQFKFGLIKKTGEMVSDYDKKFEHYQAFKSRRSAHKVA
jgi:hypothetical protein